MNTGSVPGMEIATNKGGCCLHLFNIIKNGRKYWLVDQVNQQKIRESEYKQQFSDILVDWKKAGVGYLTLLMNEAYHDWLRSNGLHQVSRTVEYTREITDLPKIDIAIPYHSLSESQIPDELYGELYEKASSASANENA